MPKWVYAIMATIAAMAVALLGKGSQYNDKEDRQRMAESVKKLDREGEALHDDVEARRMAAAQQVRTDRASVDGSADKLGRLRRRLAAEHAKRQGS